MCPFSHCAKSTCGYNKKILLLFISTGCEWTRQMRTQQQNMGYLFSQIIGFKWSLLSTKTHYLLFFSVFWVFVYFSLFSFIRRCLFKIISSCQFDENCLCSSCVQHTVISRGWSNAFEIGYGTTIFNERKTNRWNGLEYVKPSEIHQFEWFFLRCYRCNSWIFCLPQDVRWFPWFGLCLLLPFFRFNDYQHIYLPIIHRSIGREKSKCNKGTEKKWGRTDTSSKTNKRWYVCFLSAVACQFKIEYEMEKYVLT